MTKPTNLSSILVTGGTGYIGSHIVVELIKNSYEVIIIDNLSNSSEKVLERIETITGNRPLFYQFDLRDKAKLGDVFDQHSIDGVIHCAGLKAVGESVRDPLRYYNNNLESSLNLIEEMQKASVHKLVFSSSATVYGSAPTPYSEKSQTGQGITNPYGQTKYMVEQIMRDFAIAHPDSSFTILRYFNPVGAHESGLIGEDPKGTPNNLMPYIAQVAAGKRSHLSVFGDNYPTTDGTGVRDYIHVVDLAKGHLAALERQRSGLSVFNLGSGQGTSVLQLIHAFERASGKKIPYIVAKRRPGDLAEYYANADLAQRELGWKTKLTIDDACRDTWNWQRQNPDGF